MILFTMAMMFFLGYKFAYDKAIRHANKQIEEIKEDMEFGRIMGGNPDYILGNIPPLEIGGIENEK